MSEYSEECSVTPNTCCMRALPTNGTTCQHVNCKSAGRHGELPGAGPSGAVTARKTGLLHELTPQSRSGGEIERCQGLARTLTSPQTSALSIRSLAAICLLRAGVLSIKARSVPRGIIQSSSRPGITPVSRCRQKELGSERPPSTRKHSCKSRIISAVRSFSAPGSGGT